MSFSHYLVSRLLLLSANLQWMLRALLLTVPTADLSHIEALFQKSMFPFPQTILNKPTKIFKRKKSELASWH